MTNRKSVGGYLDDARRRINRLHRQAIAAPGERSPLVEDLLEEMYTALEELGASEEELRAQNEALMASGAMLMEERNARARAEDARRHAALLAEAATLLSSSTDPQATLESVAALVVPRIADSCVIYLKDGQGHLERVLATHSDLAKEEILRGVLQVPPPDPDSPASPVGRAVRTGKTVLIPEVNDAVLQSLACSADHLEILREIDPHSLLFVPLISRGEVLGAFSIGCSELGYYTPDRVALVEELGGRMALAVDNARLFAEVRNAAQARQEILSVVSHDLRNSLNTMLLHVEMILRATPSREGERRQAGRKQVEAIQRSANHMRHLVQDLLDAERIASGRLSLHPVRVAVPELMKELHELFDPAAADKEVQLETREVDVDLAVLADTERIVQVFSNLITNALQYTPSGGKVVVEARRSGESALCSVMDTGPGIPADDLPHIFDRYWHARGARESSVGLGLAIAKGIVDAHGGRIRAESAHGQGTTFAFTIPLATPPPD